MVVVKLNGMNEWWLSDTLDRISNLSAKISIDTGQLLTYTQVDELPKNVSKTYGEMGVTVFKPSTPDALTNAEHQRAHRRRRISEGKRLLRVWVSDDKYDEAKKICEKL